MLTPRDQDDLTVVYRRIQRGSVSREDWSILAALLLLSQPDDVLAAIAARGLDEFIRVSKPIYEGHAFRYDDFQRIYNRICTAAETYGEVS